VSVRTPLLLLAGFLLTTGLAAQGHEHAGHGPPPQIQNGGVFPTGWNVRPDEGGKPTEVSLADMAPGWHIVTATSGIMYRDRDRVSGSYEVTAKIHLFPSGGGHSEAFGLFVGGSHLADAGQRYLYFLIRGDGTFKVKRRDGTAATDVTSGWTPAASIAKARADGPVPNVLSVRVDKDKIRFLVNGAEVYAAPRAGFGTDGVAGLRINHNLSVHVETLDLRRS